ncbi:MAG: hypothetical protein RMJ05_13190 [Thermomicrobium sp.]|nr:hypothetical protein [Thermomicrobium sp.]MDW8007651.1 hypothetical protein [Thermomicrobium sp.]
MAASIEEFRKLLELIERHPELREELRRHVLTQELLRLPAVAHEHGERLTRIERALEQLTRDVRELTDLHRTDSERLARLEEIAARQEALLAQHGERLARLEEIAARQEALLAQHGERLARLEEIAARQEALLAQHGERLARLEEIAARQEVLLAQHGERLHEAERAIVELRQVTQRLSEAVERLVRKTTEHDRKLDRLSRLYGTEVEARAAEQIIAFHMAAGWRVITRPRFVALNGEFDVVVQLEHPEHGTRWLLVEAKGRLHPRDVVEFAGRLQRDKIRQALRKHGVSGTVAPYLFGRAIDSRVDAVAESLGIGLADLLGEAVAPRPIELV